MRGKERKEERERELERKRKRESEKELTHNQYCEFQYYEKYKYSICCLGDN